MNKQERRRQVEFEKRCRRCANYQEFKDKNWVKDGFCISFRMIYTHVNDYTKCPYDTDESTEDESGGTKWLKS